MNDGCTAKIRPFTDDSEFECELPGHLAGSHRAVIRDYAYPGSETVLEWEEGDRRTFHGTWSACSSSGCTLPLGHWGRHA